MDHSLYPLSASQRDIWYMEQVVGGSVSNICGSLLFPSNGELPSETILKGYVRQLYSINDALRIKLVKTVAGDYMQEISEDIPANIEVLTFTSDYEFQCFAEHEAVIPVAETGSLSKISVIILPDSYGILVKLHHLIGDAWSLALIANQMAKFITGEKEFLTYSFIHHLEKDNEYEKSTKHLKDVDYYVALYRNNNNVILHEDSNSHDYRANRLSFTVNSDILETLTQRATELKTSVFVYLLTAYSLLLSRREMNAENFWVGTTLLNRKGRADYNTVGMFVNTLPIPITLNHEQTFLCNIQKIGQNLMQTLRHGQCTMTDLLLYLRKVNTELTTLFDVSINYQNAQVGLQNPIAMETHWFPNHTQTEALQIQIEDRDNTNSLHIHYDYKESVFSASQIEWIHKTLMLIIQNALGNECEPLHRINWISEEEEQRLNSLAVNNKPWPFCPVNMGVWFQNLAEADPDRIILEASDGQLSYRELNEKSKIAAVGLRKIGIRAGDTVGLALPRNSLLPTYILASIIIGATFLAIDLEYPKDRIDFMLQDCQAVKCIDQQMAEALLQSDEIDADFPFVSLDNNCYCIYTSGSTGNPKGVLISQRNITNNIFWRLHAYPDRNSRIICVTAVTADTFLEDFFYAVYSGNTFCLVEDRRNLGAIRQAVGNQTNNDLMTTPTFFRAIMREVSLPHFKNVTLVGENLDSALAEEIISAGVCLHNEYGPSECSVCDTHAVLSGGDIHIGRPIDNAEIYILDRFLQPMPIGEKGELCVAGLPVGRGYIGCPEINKERFIPDYKGRGPLYRTGDIAFWREDGNISIVGRVDNQVKLRGLRIELDEIEKQINRLPGVNNSGVVVTKGEAGQQILCAFYTGEEKDSMKLTKELRKNLPEHMVPQIMTRLETMPMSQNGKVDKKKLASMDIADFDEDSAPTEPINREEQVLCSIAEQLLQTEQYYPTSNFFYSGGDSLKAMQFVVMAADAGIRLNLQMLYNYPTVRELVEQLGLSSSNLRPLDTSGLENINRLLAAQSELPERTENRSTLVGDILLTGVTGYLGIHILLEYLRNSAHKIWCIIRGKNQEECVERLKNQLLYYGDEGDIDQIGKRIRVIKGDLIQPLLGTTLGEYNAMLNQIGTVIHAAGNVKHYGLYDEFYKANVGSTKLLIDFCKAGNARLVYCSTTSIFIGAEHRDEPYSEQDFYVSQKIDNVYNRSKFEAERLVYEAVENGLQAVVMRVGNLTNRNKDMLFQKNRESNAFWNRIKAISEMRAFPQSQLSLKVDLTPVDTASMIIRLLAEQEFDKRIVFHVCSPQQFYTSELIDEMRKNGIYVDVVDDDRFEDVLHNVSQLDSSNYFATLANDRGVNGRISFENENVSCMLTEKFIIKCGYKWPEDYHDYLSRYVSWAVTEPAQ